ncbi:MAG: bacteriohemerythrin [Treponema sp.]|nr:bacteriohemerythrin [Treponema sp.]
MIDDKIHLGAEIVHWDDKYSTEIAIVDTQHKQLFELTNKLFAACREKKDTLDTAFKDAMHHLVEYVRFHFNAELKLLHSIKYPDYHNHKKQHDDLIHEILTAVKEHDEGKKFVPNHFVRTLRDWIFSHIAVHDKAYSFYIHDQIKTGKLSKDELKEIEASIAK